MSIVSGNNVFYYMTRDTLCFLCLCESSYPKRTAFLYLEEIADLVFSELTKEYGTNEWRTHVDTTSRPFSLIHYDPLIQRKQREFRNPKEVDATHANDSRLHEDLSEIQNIMRSNIDEMLNRGEKLDHVASVSSELQQKSKTFKWGAKKLTWQARLQQYGPMAAGGLFVCMVLYFKFFF
jgi:vesicle transport protein SEC22